MTARTGIAVMTAAGEAAVNVGPTRPARLASVCLRLSATVAACRPFLAVTAVAVVVAIVVVAVLWMPRHKTVVVAVAVSRWLWL